MADGKLLATGKVGAEVTPEQAKELAARCALNGLAAVDALVGLEQIVRVVKVVGFVASAEGFTGQPAVINGASEFLGEVLGEAGRHARSAVGVAELPLGAPVEVEMIVEVAPSG
jgi:enamine deaminase RidA (YjgF/YER057c/UK114 family)